MRQPKLGGFTRPRRQDYEVINVGTLESMLEAGTYDLAALRLKKLVRTNAPVKLLGDGELSKKFVLTVNSASKSARAAIAKAGGSLIIQKA